MQKIISIASVLCGESRTQREVSEISGVTEVTIRNRYKELVCKRERNRNLSFHLKIIGWI